MRVSPYAAAVLFAAPLFAGQTQVLLLRGFRPDQIRQTHFEVRQQVEVVLTGSGAGGRDSLHAYGWLFDDDRGRLVWSMQDANASDDQGGTLRFHDPLGLEPGHYTLSYFAGRSFRSLGSGGLKGLFAHRSGNPESLYVALSVDDDAVSAFATPSPEAEAQGGGQDEIRLAPLGDSTLRRERFRVLRSTDVSILAVGEAVSKKFADGSYLLSLETRQPVWTFDSSPIVAAGGAAKNRMAHVTVRLEPGFYELVATTDSTHSADSWNAPPPYLPQSWGVALTAPPGSFSRDGIPAERAIARLVAANGERLEARFRLDRETPVRVYCFGEWSSGGGLLADYGWIEREGGDTVWKMRYEESAPAGGSSKNRVADKLLRLPAGSYRVSYVTDDSHSYPDWNADRPDDARNWGITLSTFDPEARFELLDLKAAASEQHEDLGFRIKIH